jgi:membrane-bound lytic murein transglycosylase B
MIARLTASLLVIFALAAPASAAQCGGDFHQFLAGMARDAQAAGVSPNVINTAFAGLSIDPAVLAFDRRQRYTFQKSFEAYAATRVTSARVNRARALMQRHAACSHVCSSASASLRRC